MPGARDSREANEVKCSSTITALLAAVIVPLAVVAQDYETTEIAAGVYQFRWNRHNALFVTAPGQVVAFDPIGTEAAAAFAGEIQRVAPGSELAAIVYSHSDADHSAGATTLMAAFGQENVPIIAQERAVDPIRKRGDPDHPAPTVTFAERMTFELTDRRIELHYLGPSHTDNIAVGFIPDAGVAFAVDFVTKDRTGYQELRGWRFPESFEAMAGLLRIPFETVVFGHGPPGDRATIHRQIGYYDALTAAVRAAVARGLTEDEMAEQVELPAYSDFGQYEEWMPLNARAIYRWLAATSHAAGL